MPATHDPKPTLADVSQKVREICRSGELAEPDLVLGCNGEFVALWFEANVAMVVESDDEAAPGPPGFGPGADWIDPERNPDVIEAIELVFRLCAGNDFPVPDRVIGSEAGKTITFVWSGEDGFDATWNVEELVRSGGQAPAGS